MQFVEQKYLIKKFDERMFIGINDRFEYGCEYDARARINDTTFTFECDNDAR